MENKKENLKVSKKTDSSKNDEYKKYIQLQKEKKAKLKKTLKRKKQQEKREILAYEEHAKKEKQKDPERKNKLKRLFFGVGKEFWRVSWPTKKEMLNNFITVMIVSLILAGLLTGLTYLITTFVN